ncbi:MAG: T9SS type A sorting domain-containing protein [Ignavibacteriales bacterium]|nr:T9SS type A sorting domain-containing protein [Ignavibacteriales bacterium]
MRLVFVLCLLFTLHVIGFAQWQVANPSPTANTTYVGSAPSAATFVTVTGQGEAVLTHDSGKTWQVMPLPLDGIYRSTFFLDDNTGWVAGAVGSGQVRIFKTTNGGSSWVQQPNCADTTKYDIFFIDQNTGWTVGFNGMIWKTTDGGNNWFSQTNTNISTKTLYSVFATDVNNVYIAGGTDAILKSTDGGANWVSLPAIFSSATDYRGTYFPPTGTGLLGFVVGNRNRIAKTTDGGSTWQQVYKPGGTNQLWAIDFNSNGIGLAAGAASTVLRTTDFGNSWTPVTGFSSSSIIFYSVRFGDDNVAYASGSGGYFYHSTDAGATWIELGYRFTTTSMKAVGFADDNTGYAVGTTFIAKTTNGGMTWGTQTSPYTGDINGIVAPLPNVAIAGCDAGYIIRTTTGGTTWESIQTGITGTNSDILAIDFIDKDNGMVVAYNGTSARTTDGGLTWAMLSPITSGNPWDMDLVDSLNAYVACTGEKIYRTTDGGQTWVLQLAVGGLGTYGISAATKDISVAGGTSGNTYYTTNGGTTWNTAITKPGYSVWGIKMSSPDFAFAACASGYIYRSTDGGKNWSLDPRVTISTLEDIDITPRGDAFAVGSGGIVLKYQAQQLNCTNIQIKAGWNILSVPRLSVDRAAASLFPGKTSSAFGYINGYVAFDTLQYGSGYWMRFPADGMVNLCGNATGMNSIAIRQGWNIIGAYETPVAVNAVSTTPPQILTSNFFGFDNGYINGDTLVPGKGYWIRASQDGIINLTSGTQSLAMHLSVLGKLQADCPKIIFTDDNGYRRELYLYPAGTAINENAYILPPLPPNGTADVRFAAGSFAEPFNNMEKTIMLQPGVAPLQITCENTMIIIAADNNNESVSLQPGEVYDIPQGQNSLKIMAAPEFKFDYRLQQNYPNPFNPATSISYQVANTGRAILTVYDILGKKVMILTDEVKTAGRYTVSFDASALSSGSYFYELRVNDYREVKKMLLIK